VRRLLAALAVLSLGTPAAARAPLERDADDDAGAGGRRSLLRARGGFAVRRIEGIPVHGADLGFAIGGTTPIGGLRAALDLMFARTEFGLSTSSGSLGVLIDYPLGDDFHAGAGARLGVLTIERITSDSKLGALGVGMLGFGEWDFWRLGERTRGFLELRLGADIYDDRLLWGPTLGVGLRY
jgi:hypothetical protein